MQYAKLQTMSRGLTGADVYRN